MLIDGGKPMRQNQWKKAGLTVLSAVFMGSLSIAAAGTGIPALAATKDVAVTEYDEGNGIFAYRAISSVPMIAARMDATYTAFQICWKAGSASGARWLKLTIWFGFVTTM